jgi:hypothetical protein
VADIRNKAALNKVYNLYKPQVVFHAAAYKHSLMEENPAQAILTMLKEQKLGRFGMRIQCGEFRHGLYR